MTTVTPFDLAHKATQDAPEDDAARLALYECLADSELFLLLAEETDDQSLAPALIETEEGQFLMAFDLEERLTAFTGKEAPYAALPGRVIVGQLAGQGIGLGINLGVAESAILMPPEAVDWLAGMLAEAAPEADEGWPDYFLAPNLSEAVLDRLAAKLAPFGAVVPEAFLAGVGWEDGRQGHILAFETLPDAAGPEAEPALAKAVSEALAFAGLEGEEIAVVFLPADDPARPTLVEIGWRVVLVPAETAEEAEAPKGPGMDPDRPPVLR